MKSLILILLLLLPIPARAEWTRADTARQLVITGIHVIDWGQTRNIANNPDRFYELNPMLGKHPSLNEVDKYFVGLIAVHAGISFVLPEKLRRPWQYLSIGYYGMNIERNYKIGLRVDF